MKVLVICNRGFEMMEFAPFIDVFGWARNDFHHDLEIVTCGFAKDVTSAFGIPIRVDKEMDEIRLEEYDAIAIPGGFEEYGFFEEAFDQRLLNLITEADRQGIYIASVCVGALPLGISGILKGKRATTYHLNEGIRQKQLAEYGVRVIPDERVVQDGNIITSYCPETAADVAFRLLSCLIGEKEAGAVEKAMGY